MAWFSYEISMHYKSRLYNNTVHYVWVSINCVGLISVLCLIERSGRGMANTSVGIMETYRVCLKCLFKTSVVYHTKKRWGVKFVYMCVRERFVFEVQPPTFSWPLPFRSLSVRTPKNTSVFSFDWKWRHTSPVHFLMSVKPFSTTVGPLKDRVRSQSYESMHPVPQAEDMDDILSVLCKLWLDKKTGWTRQLWNWGHLFYVICW
jgi:hypothetical protein